MWGVVWSDETESQMGASSERDPKITTAATSAPPFTLRRDCSEIDAIDPATGKRWTLQLSLDVRKWAASRGKGAAMELVETVRATLLAPAAIFRGLRDLSQDSDDEWLCYSSIPTHAWDHRHHTRLHKPWPDQVFCVYVRMPERMIFNWNWSPSDAANPKLPENHEQRFRERLL